MADRVDAAIAALKVALKEAEKRGKLFLESAQSELLDRSTSWCLVEAMTPSQIE